jgi:UDP-N-acetylmuramate--alanine ligase
MKFEDIHNIYFLGIGGIGMSALARYFHILGKNIAGYDLTENPITDELQKSGIHIHFRDDISEIPDEFLDKTKTLIVITPAIPTDHKELIYFQVNGFRIMKRSEVLGILFNAKKGIAIAGTHGKTSVTSMCAYILHNSPLGCSAFLGGIIKNLSSNLIHSEKSPWIVAEADEYDRSFLHLKPTIALITWVDADHLDVYTSLEDIRRTFEKFLCQVNKGGKIILKEDIHLNYNKEKVSSYTYSLDSGKSDFYAKNLTCRDGLYTFDIVTPGSLIKNVTLRYKGLMNVENAVAAAAVAYIAGIDVSVIAEALSTFEGVQRRFDVQYEDKDTIYIDDYAHHPRELNAIIGSVRKLYPGKRITGVFQPHLYSRTRDFNDEFAESLSALDELILLDIYPAREKPIAGVSSRSILDKVTIPAKSLCNKKDLLGILKLRRPEVLITMGAGDIDRLVVDIKKLLETK